MQDTSPAPVLRCILSGPLWLWKHYQRCWDNGLVGKLWLLYGMVGLSSLGDCRVHMDVAHGNVVCL